MSNNGWRPTRRSVLRTAGLGALAAGLPGLAGCGGSSGPQGGGGAPDTLAMAFVDGWQTWIDDALAAYTGSGGPKVTLDLVPGLGGTSGWAALAVRINAQRQAGKAPDFSYLGVPYLPDMIARGQVTDLAPLLDAAGLDLSTFAPASLERFRDGDHLWALPGPVQPQVMYYNKTLLDKAGIAEPPASWEKPWTFEQWRAAAEAMTTPDGKVYGTAISLLPERTCQYLWSNGATTFSEDLKTFEMASPEAIATYEFLAGFFKDKLTPPQSLIDSLGSPAALFQAGRVGMMLDGTWSMRSAAAIKDFEWGVAPPPVGSTGKSYTPVWVDAWIIPKGSRHSEAAMKVIAFMESRQGLSLLIKSENIGGIPPVTSVAQAEAANTFTGLPAERKQVWHDSTKHVKNYAFPVNYSQIRDVFTQQLALISNGEQPPAKVLQDLTGIVQPLLR